LTQNALFGLRVNGQMPAVHSASLKTNKTSSAVAEMGGRLATIDIGRKLGAVLLSVDAGSPSNTMWPAPTPTFVPSGILIHPAV